MVGEFFDLRILRALELAERCADDPRAEAVADTVWYELGKIPRPRLPEDGPEGEIVRGSTAVWQLLDEWWDGLCYRSARHAIAHATFLCLRHRPREILTGGVGNAAEYCAQAIDDAESLLLGGKPKEVELDGPETETETEIRRAIANLLRDIFGNPFRPSPPLPLAVLTWNDAVVVRLAQAAYEERHLPAGALDNSRLAVLADALEEAGCTDADILDHLRGPGPHVRGCWAVDLCLGKS
jgi:hypothetical protein